MRCCLRLSPRVKTTSVCTPSTGQVLHGIGRGRPAELCGRSWTAALKGPSLLGEAGFELKQVGNCLADIFLGRLGVLQ